MVQRWQVGDIVGAGLISFGEEGVHAGAAVDPDGSSKERVWDLVWDPS